MDDNIKKQITEKCDRFASEIMELCDSAQVFVTFHDGGRENTGSYECGKGNFYARQGQVAEFLEIQRQYQKNWAIRKENET